MRDAEAWYALAWANLGARAALRLLEAFQHPRAAFDATPREWTVRARITPKGCSRLLEAANRDHGSDLARFERLGVRMLCLHDEDYPARLRTIADPPCVLFVKGALSPADARAVAIVGSRRASPYGRHVAAELAADLARRGVTVVSGMALGADAAAHEGCMRAGGRTIAVLGNGIDVVYPPEHADLYERIAASGAVLCELPLGEPPGRMNFPVRNRIISGLTLGVVVVEAPEKSGALITAEHALEQGREVFAVPGSVGSVQSRGSHRLLREGARLVESVEDIIEELAWQVEPSGRRAAPLPGPQWDATVAGEVQPSIPSAVEEDADAPHPAARPDPVCPAPSVPDAPPLSPEEEGVLRLLTVTAKHVDDLIQESALAPAQVNSALLMLELKGHVQRRPGNLYVRLR